MKEDNSGIVLEYLEQVIGKSEKRSKGNYAFHCPFCNHRKPKLEVQIHTDTEGKNRWACWVCRSRGTTLYGLLKELKVDKDTTLKILKYVSKGNISFKDSSYHKIELPSEFRSIHKENSNSILVRQAKNYLYKRGLTEIDFYRYDLGFCTKGRYKDRIVIPSYDSQNRLNFFVTRAYTKSGLSYLLPDFDKDVVFFENLINWDLPIILCEGVFDAMSIRRNAIPLLGKFMQTSLFVKLITASTSKIYIALDSDARKDAIKVADLLYHYNKEVYFVNMPKKDPSEMGFEAFSNILEDAEVFDDYFLLKNKLESI